MDKDVEEELEKGQDQENKKPVFNTLTYADLLVKQGYISEAKKIYESLLASYPGKEIIIRKLERLKRES